MRGCLLIFIFTFISVKNNFSQTPANFKFRNSTESFGKVFQKEIVSLKYEFENTGDEPLLISDIKVTCGCTKPEWPSAPIKKGEKGEINVRFDTTGKYDRQDRTIEVISNATGSPHKLRFKGVVLKPKDKE